MMLMHWHQLRYRFPKCLVTSHIVRLFALHFVSPIQLLSLYQLIQFLTCTRNLVEIHTAKMVLWGVVFTKCFSMRMTLDLLHELANTEVFCLFHNCMWQSRLSEVNVYVPRVVWTNRFVVHSQVSPCLFHLYSWVSTCFKSFNMWLDLLFCINSLIVNAPTFSLFTCTWISLQMLTLLSYWENKRVRWYSYTTRRLQQTSVSCKRSYCNKWKNLESRTSEVLSKDGKQRVSPFYHVALHVSSFIDFLWIMKTTRIHSIATNLRKNLMMGAFPSTSSRASTWVVVLQILGVNGLMWSTHRWSQNDFSMVRIFRNYWEKSTSSLCIESTLLASYDVWNLFAQAHPSWNRPLQFDHVRVEIHVHPF